MLIADEEVPRMRAALGQVRLELETQRYVEALPAVLYPVLAPRPSRRSYLSASYVCVVVFP